MIYTVSITPLIGEGVYSDTAHDVTERLARNGIGKIRATIDNSDYVVGVFSFDDVKLKFLNYDRMLSTSFAESIFGYQRDNACENPVWWIYI